MKPDSELPASYIDAHERVTGRVPFALNMALPNMLHGAILRSPYPHARLVRIDPRPALKVPGVVATLTRDDILDNPAIKSPRFGPVIKDQPIVALDKVHFTGDAVAAVAARDRETAKFAAGLIEVEFEELPGVFTIDEALAEGAPLVHEQLDVRRKSFPDIILEEASGTNYCNHFVLRHGDVEAGFEEADLVVEDRFETAANQHVPMEPHVTLAEVGPGGAITIWSSTQTPYLVRAQVAEIFDLPESRVRVVVPTLGGGYGAKTYPKLEPLTAALAWKAGAPVKILLDRDEEFWTIRKHDAVIVIKTGVKADGTIVARQIESWWDAGAYADISPRYIMFAGFYGPGPYRIPNVSVHSHAVYTNKPPSGAFRGFAAPQDALAYEGQLDRIARELKMDPVEIRRKNLLRSGDRYATGEIMDDIHFEALLEDASRGIQWGEDDRGDLPAHLRRGKGIATIMMATITPSTSNATIKVNGDGSVNLLSSTVEMGQGSRTALAQIAAQAMSVPLSRVSIVDPDTDVTPYDLTTSASRSTFSMGGAVRLAADDAKRQLLKLAADLLEEDYGQTAIRGVGALEIHNGTVSARGTELSLSFGEIIRRSRAGTIVGHGSFTTKGGLEPKSGQGVASSQWHQCAAGVELLVDVETGLLQIERLHVNTYTGRTINHRNTELQVEGAALFGLGAAVMEEMIYDQGQLTNPNLSDYMIPSFLDVPKSMTTTLFESSEPGMQPHGLGENGVGPVPAAIAGAIFDALGIRMRELPITPERILRSLKGTRQNSVEM